MKLKTIHIRYVLISILLIVFAGSVTFSQDSGKTDKSLPSLYLGINAGPSKTFIVNNRHQSLYGLSSSGRYSFSGSLELGYNFSKVIGLSIGLGYDSYSSEFSLDSCKNKFNTTDSENEPYERRVNGLVIKELQNISFLSLPVGLIFQVPFGSKFGLFLQAGANFSVPVNKKYESSGTFTYTGFYPAYNILLQDLPEYGFENNAAVTSKGELELKTININAQAGAGFQYFINEKIQIALGVNYSRSLTSISNYSSPEDFQISPDVSKINSLMGGSSKSTTNAMGLRLSLRYYFK